MHNRKDREQLGRIGGQLQDIANKAKAEGNRGLTSEERERFHALEADFTELEDRIKVGERIDSITDRLAAGNGSIRINETNLEQVRDEFQLSPAEKRRRDSETNPHAKAFGNLLRLGDRVGHQDRATLTAQNAQATNPGSQGGDLIPQGFSNQLESAKKWYGGIEGTVEKFTTSSGNSMPWPTTNDTINKGRIIGQNVQMSETDLVFGSVTFSAYIGSSDLVLAPLSLVDDSYFDLEGLIARLLGIRLGRLYNQKCTIGTGTSEPTGIVTAAVAAGSILQLGTGNTAAISYNNLVDLEHTVDPAYRENPSSKWMFSDTVLKLLKKLVDGQSRPLWQPGLTASFQQGAAVVNGMKPKILEHEYVINQDMAVPAASAYSMLFGDMSTFKVREVAGGTTVLVLRERYADYLQVGYTAFQRFDSNLIDAGTHPIAVLQQSAT